MRAYWNNSNEFITYKIWLISVDRITKNNLKIITDSGTTARIIQDSTQTIDHNGYQYSYRGLPGKVEFETTCDEQESMLKLLYGKDLTLMQVNVVAPFTMIQSKNYDTV